MKFRWISDVWIRGLRALATITRRLAVGGLAARVSPPRLAETQAHAVSFNDLAATLEQCMAELAATEAERKRLESQLQHAPRMEAVGRLAGGVAHDFNNLITVIFACVDEALDHTESDAASKQLREIRAAAERAASLTRQLLAFSRKQVLQPRVLDLNETLTGVDRLLRRVIGEDIDLQTTCDPSLGAVLLDPHQIEQVIVNMAVNARDAMPMGGRLLLSTRATSFRVAQPSGGFCIPAGDYAELAIRDTGVGMTPDVQARVFEPFFTTKGDEGTGLGLATVFGIVKQSEGFILVESEPNRGTTFRMYFPVTTLPTMATVVRQAHAEVPGEQVILVVEDEAAVRSLVVAGLRRSGYQVVEAASPTTALEIAGAVDHLDLVLADLMLPEMNGTVLAGRVQKLWPEVRVSFMSGYPDAEMVRRGILNPLDPFLQKPFNLQALTAHVQAVLRGAPAATARAGWPELCATAAVA